MLRLRSLEVACVYFLDELGLELVQGNVTGVESRAEGPELLTLGPSVLVEFLLIGLELAGGSALGEQVAVGVVDLDSWLSGIVVEQVGPEGHVATDEPQVVVALDEAAVDGDTRAGTPEGENGVDVPCEDACGLLVALVVEGAVGSAEGTVELADLRGGDVAEELS